MTGIAVLGERKVRVGPPLATGSVVHISANAVLGTVTVDDRERSGGLLKRSAHPPAAHGSRPGRRLLRAALAIAAAAAVGGLVGTGQVLGSDDGTSLFGSRQVRLTDDTDRVEVGTLFGSTRVVVPDDVQVRTTGTFVFGAVECGDACTATTGREVEVEADGAFGSVEVVTLGELAEAEP
jgi:hypothetical protein